jgi:hypothetical protein
MSVDAGRTKSFFLHSDGLPEKSALDPRNITRCHRNLINPVQNSGNGGEVVGLENLAILEQTQRTASPIPKLCPNSYCSQFDRSLKK